MFLNGVVVAIASYIAYYCFKYLVIKICREEIEKALKEREGEEE